jgi:hypothetical protein
MRKRNPAVLTLSSLTLMLFITITFSACARKIDFGSSQLVPGADGYIKLSSDNNKNTSISVKVYHLAPVEMLNPPGKVYVFWMTTDHDGIRNIGQLKNMNLLFSRVRKAGLKTVTAFKPKNFFITAENSGTVTEPRQEIVLKTE